MNYLLETFGRYMRYCGQFVAAETQKLISDMAEDLPNCVVNTSTAEPTGSAFIKAKIFKEQAFHLNVSKYLSFSDKARFTQAIIEVADKYFSALEKRSKQNIEKIIKAKQAFIKRVIQRNSELFPQELQLESIQNRISNLALLKPNHPFVQSLTHFSNQVNELQCIPEHRLSSQMFQNLAANNSEIVSVKLFKLNNGDKIDAFASCEKIKTLHLPQFSGDIDRTVEIIGNSMKNLEELCIEWYDRGNVIPQLAGSTLDKLPKTLTTLTLTQSHIGDIFLKNLPFFPALKKLNLNYSNSQIKEDFSCLPESIEVLNLRFCARINSTIDLSKLTKLVDLDLSCNVLGRHSLKQLSVPFSIKRLDISSNFLSDAIFKSLKNLQKMTHLILDNNKIHGIGISSLSKTIESLSLKECYLDVNAIKELQQLPKLTELNISGSTFEEDWVLLLPESLEKLHIDNLKLTDAVFDKLKRLKNLTHLSISDNEQITGRGLSLLPATLQELRVSNCNLSDAGLLEISQLQKLTSLIADHNMCITSKGISNLPASITSLDLKKCLSLNNSTFESLHHLICLTSLNMQGIWNITGSNIHLIPKTVTYLNLADCYLSKKAVDKLHQNPQFLEFIFIPPNQMGITAMEERVWNN